MNWLTVFSEPSLLLTPFQHVHSLPNHLFCGSHSPALHCRMAKECSDFLLHCSLALEMQLHHFPNDCTKIFFVLSLLAGRSLQWAQSNSKIGLWLVYLRAFINRFKKVSDHSIGDSCIIVRLYKIRQAIKFHTLAAASSWNMPSLLTTYSPYT